MATVIRCDACDHLTGPKVVAAYFVVGGMALTNGVETQFFASDRPDEYLLCASCAEYLDRCVEALMATQPERALS